MLAWVNQKVGLDKMRRNLDLFEVFSGCGSLTLVPRVFLFPQSESLSGQLMLHVS